MFSAHSAIDDRNKGWDLLEHALNRAATAVPGLECVIVGAERPLAFREPGFPIRWLGCIRDERMLPLIYGAADVVAVPSRCENLPQVATEAQACGRPVVAFATSGLNEAVVDGATGYLVAPYLVSELGDAISNLLNDRAKAREFSLAAARRAHDVWSASAVMPKLLKLYDEVLLSHARGRVR
jgi:glycosyltransferase involved in cell wall biosynthesis